MKSNLKKELLELEKEKYFVEIPLLDYIYIITTRKKHDSGYICMEIIGENKQGYKKKLATFSDVIDLNSLISNRTKYGLLSIDVPEYNVIRLFSSMKFKIEIYGSSTFMFDLVEVGDNYEK